MKSRLIGATCAKKMKLDTYIAEPLHVSSANGILSHNTSTLYDIIYSKAHDMFIAVGKAGSILISDGECPPGFWKELQGFPTEKIFRSIAESKDGTIIVIEPGPVYGYAVIWRNGIYDDPEIYRSPVFSGACNINYIESDDEFVISRCSKGYCKSSDGITWSEYDFTADDPSEQESTFNYDIFTSGTNRIYKMDKLNDKYYAVTQGATIVALSNDSALWDIVDVGPRNGAFDLINYNDYVITAGCNLIEKIRSRDNELTSFYYPREFTCMAKLKNAIVVADRSCAINIFYNDLNDKIEVISGKKSIFQKCAAYGIAVSSSDSDITDERIVIVGENGILVDLIVSEFLDIMINEGDSDITDFSMLIDPSPEKDKIDYPTESDNENDTPALSDNDMFLILNAIGYNDLSYFQYYDASHSEFIITVKTISDNAILLYAFDNDMNLKYSTALKTSFNTYIRTIASDSVTGTCTNIKMNLKGKNSANDPVLFNY